LKNTQKKVLVEKFELEFCGQVFKLAIFIHDCNVPYYDQLSQEKIERVLLEYFQLLQSHGYDFRRKEYYIPVIIKQISRFDGMFSPQRKEIHIAQRLINREAYSLCETLIHELTHYFIFDSWRNHQCYRDHFSSPCYYFHEGLAELLTALMFNKNFIEMNPHLGNLHSCAARKRHFSYYLAEIFFRHPGKFRGLLCGLFLFSKEAFRKMERLVIKLTMLEFKLLNSFKTVRANCIIKANNNFTNHRGYSICYDSKLMPQPLVSPIEHNEIERANMAGVTIVSDKSLFQTMNRLIRKDFTYLPIKLFGPVIKIFERYNCVNRHKQSF